MVFLEILKSNGLSEEQISAITREMGRNKIYITYEEKIEERYKKMKLQRDTLRSRLKLAEEALEKLNMVFKSSIQNGEGVKRYDK